MRYRYIVKPFGIHKWIVFDDYTWETVGSYDNLWVADIHAEYLNG